jgi:signal transduction histidine kinase
MSTCSHAFALVVYVVVGVFVVTRDPRNPVYRAFSLMTLALALHAGGAFARLISSSESVARGSTLIIQLGLALIAPSILLFTCQHLDMRGPVMRACRILFWLASAVVATAALSDYLSGTELVARLTLSGGRWGPADFGVMGKMLNIMLIVSFVVIIFTLLISYLGSVGLRRVQLQFYGIGFAIAAAIGAVGLVTKNASWAPLGTIVLYLFIAYAITRYQFLDIRVVIRLGTLYLTVGAVFFGLYVGLIAIGTSLFGRHFAADSWAFPIVGITVVAVLFEPLRNRVQRLLDRAFFRQQINTAAALESLSGAIGRVGRVAELERLLADTLVPALHPESFRLFVRHDPAGPDGKPSYRALPTARGDATGGVAQADEDLAAWCAAEKRPCLRDAIRWEAERGRPVPDPEIGPRLRCLLDALGRDRMDVVVPLLRELELTGLLALGPKRAQIPYPAGEIDFVSAVAAQAALALENIRLNESARAMEKDLHEADKRAALGVIASEIAHEVRNPLSVVKTYVRLLPEKGSDPEFLQRFQERASPELDRVEGILNDILAGVAGQRRANAEVRLEAVAEAVLDFFAEEMAHRRITTDRDWNGAVPPLTGDAGQLRQVFHNLIQNALQAMPGGGRLRVRIAPVPDAVHIEIADTGPGIPPERIPRLFRPFSTTKPGGTGLGLAISQRIVQEHGGSIRVESRPDEGATFIIDLPLEGR